MSTVNCLFASILQNFFFCVQQKKEVRTGLDQLEWVNDDRIVFLWVNYPIKKSSFTNWKQPLFFDHCCFYDLFIYLIIN